MSQGTDHIVGVADGALAAVDYGGAGPDVVLVHGGNRTLLDWTPLRALLPSMRLIAYDLRGHGRSTVPRDADYSFEGHQNDLCAVLGHFGLERPFVVGHSIGGNVAVRAAGTGVPLAGAVSLDGYGPGVYDGEDRAERLDRLNAEIYASLEPDVVPADEVPALVGRYRRMMEALEADIDLAEPTTLRALAETPEGDFERRPPMSHQAALAGGLEEVDFFGLVEAASCPILVVKSEQQVPVGHLSAENQAYVAALAEGAEKALAEAESAGRTTVRRVDAGHMLHLQSPVEVAELVADFIARNWDR